jgi:hypothetical protein
MLFLGAFFAVTPQKTGLSAPIPRKRLRRFLRDFRFYPLRGYKPALFSMESGAHFCVVVFAYLCVCRH